MMETIREINELPFLKIMMEHGESSAVKYIDEGRKKITYLEVMAAFDIETTLIKGDPPFSFMYHWQFCIDKYVVFGRTWDDFQNLLRALERNLNLSDTERLVIWVHNLAYEYVFMKQFIDIKDIFALSVHRPIKILTRGGIEFRCSYALTNKTLEAFTHAEECIYEKTAENFNYSALRTADTVLNDDELSYCYIDVRGLCEALAHRLQGETLAHVPVTSTGFVRRDCRNAMRKNRKNRENFTASALDTHLYAMMRNAFRGGNTHANFVHSDMIMENVTSYDIESSYPACMLLEKFPMTAFFESSADDFCNPAMRGKYAFIFVLRLLRPRFIASHGVPYLPVSKCKTWGRGIYDNGRILKADAIEITVTDIDYDIIKKQYVYEDEIITDVWASKYDYLSPEFTAMVFDYYQRKTALKGKSDSVYEYNRSKEYVNSTYGMMVTRPDRETIAYINGELKEIENTDLSEMLDKFYKSRNNFLSYQHGVWVTAHARKRLQKAIDLIGHDLVYVDTDSVKFIGNHDIFSGLNADNEQQVRERGFIAYDSRASPHFPGNWDHDASYKRFSTLGAKKYIYEDENGIHTTIAGVSKKRGAEFFTERGMELFKVGTIIPDSGHLTAWYNEEPVHDITVEGCTMKTASNIALVDGTYTLGITEEYSHLLNPLKFL